MEAEELVNVAEFIKKMKFRKKLVGGVDEADVWKKIEALNAEYRKAYDILETRYKTLLAERDGTLNIGTDSTPAGEKEEH